MLRRANIHILSRQSRHIHPQSQPRSLLSGISMQVCKKKNNNTLFVHLFFQNKLHMEVQTSEELARTSTSDMYTSKKNCGLPENKHHHHLHPQPDSIHPAFRQGPARNTSGQSIKSYPAAEVFLFPARFKVASYIPYILCSKKRV